MLPVLPRHRLTGHLNGCRRHISPLPGTDIRRPRSRTGFRTSRAL